MSTIFHASLLPTFYAQQGLAGLSSLSDSTAFPLSQDFRTRSLLFAARAAGRLRGYSRLAWSLLDASTECFDRSIAARLRSIAVPFRDEHPPLFYGYEDAAFESTRVAADLGLLSIVEMPIIHPFAHHDLALREGERYPELMPWFRILFDSEEKRSRKHNTLLAASCVIANSSATHRSLLDNGIPPKKIVTIPYGIEPLTAPTHHPPSNGPIRFLFVGRIGPRKGVHRLLEAWRILQPTSPHSLTLIGPREVSQRWLREALGTAQYLGPLSRAELARQYKAHDVLVFPSLADGFGLVLLEAMAAGLSFIATPLTAAPDLITKREEGFVVPVANTDQLATTMAYCMHHPAECRSRGIAAAERAAEFSWDRYRTGIRTTVQRLVSDAYLPGREVTP